MGLFERAMAGLGKGMADVGEIQFRAQVEEMRQMRLAEYQTGVTAQRDQQKREWENEDFDKKKEWESEKMKLAHDYAMQRKGAGRGRGGGAGSQWLEEEEVDENGIPTGRMLREQVSGGGGGGGARGKSGGGGGGRLPHMNANGQVVNLRDSDEQGILNMRTGEVLPIVRRADSRLPEGVHGPQENPKEPRYERVRLDDKLGTEKAAESGKSTYDWDGVEVEAKVILTELRAYNEGVPPSKRMTVEQFMKAQKITKSGGGSGGLIGGAANLPEPGMKSDAPQESPQAPAPKESPQAPAPNQAEAPRP